jgi:hypothetical protein
MRGSAIRYVYATQWVINASYNLCPQCLHLNLELRKRKSGRTLRRYKFCSAKNILLTCVAEEIRTLFSNKSAILLLYVKSVQ